MDAETWMDATAAIDLGFANEILTSKQAPTPNKDDEPTKTNPKKHDDPGDGEDEESASKQVPGRAKNERGVVFSRKVSEQQLVAQLAMNGKSATPPGPPPPVSEHPCLKPAACCGRRVVDLYAHLTNQPH